MKHCDLGDVAAGDSSCSVAGSVRVSYGRTSPKAEIMNAPTPLASRKHSAVLRGVEGLFSMVSPPDSALIQEPVK